MTTSTAISLLDTSSRQKKRMSESIHVYMQLSAHSSLLDRPQLMRSVTTQLVLAARIVSWSSQIEQVGLPIGAAHDFSCVSRKSSSRRYGSLWLRGLRFFLQTKAMGSRRVAAGSVWVFSRDKHQLRGNRHKTNRAHVAVDFEHEPRDHFMKEQLFSLTYIQLPRFFHEHNRTLYHYI